MAQELEERPDAATRERRVADMKQRAIESNDRADEVIAYYDQLAEDATHFWRGMYQGFRRVLTGR